MADKAAPAQVLRDNLADLAAIQAQCREIGESEVGSGEEAPNMENQGDQPPPKIGRPVQGHLKKHAQQKERGRSRQGRARRRPQTGTGHQTTSTSALSALDVAAASALTLETLTQLFFTAFRRGRRRGLLRAERVAALRRPWTSLPNTFRRRLPWGATAETIRLLCIPGIPGRPFAGLPSAQSTVRSRRHRRAPAGRSGRRGIGGTGPRGG